jgi:hypothetical protein
MSMEAISPYATGCLVCGEELIYRENPETRICFYCGVDKTTSACCGSGHYVCDACHNGTANDLIERCCRNTDSVSPFSLAITLMKNPLLKMHGPEHHFLVPAVLIASFYNHKGAPREVLAEKLGQARKRAEDVKGGFCGFCGACGAAIGAGIFVSVVTGATPLSDVERKISNMVTAECLWVIAENGGPRCCKRETYWSIITAVEFVARELGLMLPLEVPECLFNHLNRECLEERCRFFRKADR